LFSSGEVQCASFASCFQNLKDAYLNKDSQLSLEEYTSFVTAYTAGAVPSPLTWDLVLDTYRKKKTNVLPIEGIQPRAPEASLLFAEGLCRNVTGALVAHFSVEVKPQRCIDALNEADTDRSKGILFRDPEYLQFLSALTGTSVDVVSGFDSLPAITQAVFNDMAVDDEIAATQGPECLGYFCQRAALAVVALEKAAAGNLNSPMDPTADESPTQAPTVGPPAAPTIGPTAAPTKEPTVMPMQLPTQGETNEPTAAPTDVPTKRQHQNRYPSICQKKTFKHASKHC
jgi:hypothetical protein